jgi:hypothetical protein
MSAAKSRSSTLSTASRARRVSPERGICEWPNDPAATTRSPYSAPNILAHDADDQLALDQEADDQLALDQEALDQDALDHDADDQLALDQDALDHEA